MSIWETTFDDAFWLTLSGAMFAFGGVCLQAILKSRCREFHCCGLGCVRDVAPVGLEPDLELGRIQTPITPITPLGTATTSTSITSITTTPPPRVRI